MANHKGLIILFILILTLTGKGVFSATPLESVIPKKDLPRGWALIHGPQTYNKKTLFEHINGQAELYLKYGFRQSVFAIYQDKKKAENQIEVDIYDMGNVVQAFGVFSRFRNEDRPGGFGLDSYLDDHSALFYKGQHFVLFYATESNPDILKLFGKLLSSRISDSTPPPKEISFFPKHGLKPGSIQYFPEGLLGHQFLKRGFQGTYEEKVEAEAKEKVEVKVEDKNRAKAEEREFKLFLAVFKDFQEATNALKAYKEDLSKKGKVLSGGSIPFEARALKGEDPYQGKVIIMQKGSYLLGAVGFQNDEDAENRLKEFSEKVK